MTLDRMLNFSVLQCFSSVKWAINIYLMVFPRGSVVKNPPAKAGDTDSILGQEDPLEKEMATRPSILAWKIP